MLLQIADLRKEWRTKNGATGISIPECELHVRLTPGKEPEISLEQIDMGTSRARLMVSELMVLANEAMASIGNTPPLSLVFNMTQVADDLPYILT